MSDFVKNLTRELPTLDDSLKVISNGRSTLGLMTGEPKEVIAKMMLSVFAGMPRFSEELSVNYSARIFPPQFLTPAQGVFINHNFAFVMWMNEHGLPDRLPREQQEQFFRENNQDYFNRWSMMKVFFDDIAIGGSEYESIYADPVKTQLVFERRQYAHTGKKGQDRGLTQLDRILNGIAAKYFLDKELPVWERQIYRGFHRVLSELNTALLEAGYLDMSYFLEIKPPASPIDPERLSNDPSKLDWDTAYLVYMKAKPEGGYTYVNIEINFDTLSRLAGAVHARLAVTAAQKKVPADLKEQKP